MVNKLKRIKDNWDLRVRGIEYLDSEVNKLQMFSSETLDHWTTKAIAFYHLRKLRHDVITEFHIPGMGQGDILDLTTHTQYEIETSQRPSFHQKRVEAYRRLGVDIVIIPVAKLPKDIPARSKEIQRYLRPD